MSYDQFELSKDSGAPFYLYRFAKQTEIHQFYSHPGSRTVASLSPDPFVGKPIKHGPIYQGQVTKKDALDISFPLGDDFAKNYAGRVAPGITSVTIWRGHFGDPDSQIFTIFKGRVRSGRGDRQTINIVCSSLFSQLRNYGVRPRQHRHCQHALYYGLCRLNLADWQVSLTATAAADEIYTITGADANGDDYYTGGILDFNGSMVFIIRQIGTDVTLRQSLPILTEAIAANGSANVLLAPGCNRTMDHCKNRFDNLLNFGGSPYMPVENPFRGVSVI